VINIATAIQGSSRPTSGSERQGSECQLTYNLSRFRQPLVLPYNFNTVNGNCLSIFLYVPKE